MSEVYLVMLLAKFKNDKRVIIEGDNKLIMDSLKSSVDCPIWSLLPLHEKIQLASSSYIDGDSR